MDTIRRFPRTSREAFRIYPESCLGVEKPIEVGRRSLLWHLWNFVKRVFR